jgi:hypothetical protein
MNDVKEGPPTLMISATMRTLNPRKALRPQTNTNPETIYWTNITM